METNQIRPMTDKQVQFIERLFAILFGVMPEDKKENLESFLGNHKNGTVGRDVKWANAAINQLLEMQRKANPAELRTVNSMASFNESMTDKQLAYIEALLSKLANIMPVEKKKNLESILASHKDGSDIRSKKWASEAIEALKAIQTKANLAKVMETRAKMGSSF